MHGQEEWQSEIILYARERAHRMPIMTMHYIEFAEELLHCTKAIIERIAHAVHLSQDITTAIYISPLVMDAVDLVIGFKITSARKDMYFMAPSGQRF
jgi:poly(A) polymerase Pap1